MSLRRTLLLPLDDLLAVVRECLNPHVSRSGLDRCLRRHGVSRLKDLKPKALRPAHKPFKAYEPGFLHIDVKYLPQMADEERRRYLFVAIDRATRWVFVRIYPAKTAANARRFLRDLERTAPMKITKVLTDNGKEFTDRLFGLRKRAATGNHDFDRLCADLGIEHRLAPPMRPQTNGMVERFNGRIEDVLQSHRFRSGEDLEQTILRYVRLYNGQLPQSVLKGRTRIDALKQWHREKPELFKKRRYNHTGCDTLLVPSLAADRPDALGRSLSPLRPTVFRAASERCLTTRRHRACEVIPSGTGGRGQGPAQCILSILGQRRAQKRAALLESASVIRRPERMIRAPARSTRSRRRRRLQPVPVTCAMARRAMCISW